jgi:hypothetical protein
MSISTKASQSTSFASEQVTAYLLAQEGVELAQKARDDLMLEYYNNPGTRPNPWADFINPSGTYRWCHNANGCGMNTTIAGELSAPINCGGANSSACLLRYDAAAAIRSRYNYSSGETTEFRRRILFSTAGNEVRVVSRVDWRTGDSGTLKSVEVETYLFNIYDN